MDYLRKGNIVPDMFNHAVNCLCDLASTLNLSPYLPVSVNTESESDCLYRDSERILPQTNTNNNVQNVHQSASKDDTVVLQLEDIDVEDSDYMDAELRLTNDSGEQKEQVSMSEERSLLIEPYSASMVVSSSGYSSEYNQQESLVLSEALTEAARLPSDRPNMPQQDTLSKMNYCSFDSVQQRPDVKFLLDQEEVQAHRNILIRSSEYFACLLEGPYMESRQNIVPIGGISKKALVIILHTLYGCLHTQCSHVTDLRSNGSTVVLESIACAGRFLLWPVQNQLCDILVEDFLDPTTVGSHYSFGLAHSCSRLTRACLVYMLTNSQVSPKHFQDLVERRCGDDAFKTIERMLTDVLCSRD